MGRDVSSWPGASPIAVQHSAAIGGGADVPGHIVGLIACQHQDGQSEPACVTVVMPTRAPGRRCSRCQCHRQESPTRLVGWVKSLTPTVVLATTMMAILPTGLTLRLPAWARSPQRLLQAH